jgi:hypothetical protein
VQQSFLTVEKMKVLEEQWLLHVNMGLAKGLGHLYYSVPVQLS